jgi:glycine/D-amino acid oxidase-like deaminating enzyme
VLTRKRDLRTGVPVWLAHGNTKLHIAKRSAISPCDVAVIGTGISGALVADALQNAGLKVVAVDRRTPASGSTPASTALLLAELDTPVSQLQKRIGRTGAARVWWRSAAAVQGLKERVQDLGIDCDLTMRPTIYLSGNTLDVGALKQESLARQKIGLRAEFLDRAELRRLSGIERAGALFSRGNAEVDPVKLVGGIWRQFLRRGGRLVPNMQIDKVDQSQARVRLESRDGRVVFARHAVFCTGYELIECVRPKGFKIISTWVLATKRQPRALWPNKSLIWEAADPYLYLRTTADGRAIVGGEDEPFADEEKRDLATPQKIAAIMKKASRLLPAVDFNAAFQWTGSFGESPNGIPAIGPIRGMPRCYAVLGFGGNGITFSMLAAQLVSRAIQGIKDPDRSLFLLD